MSSCSTVYMLFILFPLDTVSGFILTFRLHNRPVLRTHKAAILSSRHYSTEPLPEPHAEGKEKNYPPKIQNIVEDISKLTLLEVADLNELLKVRDVYIYEPSRQNLSSGLLAWSNTNRALQPQKMNRFNRGLKFQIKEEEGLYYLCSENKGAGQHMQVFAYAGFLMMWLLL